MRIFAILLDVICTFQEGFWLFTIVDTLFKRRTRLGACPDNRWIPLGANILCMMIITLGMNQITLTSSYTVVVLTMVSTVTVCFCWKSDILSAFSVIGAYFFCMFIVASIEFYVTGKIGGESLIQQVTMEQNSARIVFLFINGCIWFSINFFFLKWLRNININRKSMKYLFCISLIGFAGGSFIVGQMPMKFNSEIYSIWYSFLVVMIICVYSTYFFVKKRELQIKLQVMHTQNDMLMRNYEQVNDFYNENAKLYHDMNKHLDMLYYMLERGEKEQAKQYIESLKEPLHSPAITIRTGNDMIDVIFCEMEKKAKDKGVQMIIDAQRLPGNITIEKKDLCALFVNILENAVEAAEKEVNVQVAVIHQMMILQVKNDYLNRPVKVNGRFKSTKKDSEHHGWGTQIVEQIVNKYEGSIEYKIQENTFCVDIMFNI